MQILCTWLQVSDLHFGHGTASHRWDQQLVLDQMFNDVTGLSKVEIAKPDYIVVTGDIAFSGNIRDPHEYDKAKDWIFRLTQALDLGHQEVFLIPGNHDIQRVQNREVNELIKSIRSGEKTIDDALSNETSRELLLSRLQNYFSFSETFGYSSQNSVKSIVGQATLEFPKVILKLVGLNTSLLSTGDDYKNLALGKEQLAHAFGQGDPESNRKEIIIVLTHHPFDWLKDGREAECWVQTKANIHLHGHLHDSKNELIKVGGGTSLIRVASAAAHGDQEGVGDEVLRHGYNFFSIVETDNSELLLRIWPRMWSTKNAQFRYDVDSLPDGKISVDYPLIVASRTQVAEKITQQQTIPYRRSFIFTGREQTIRQISDTLNASGIAILSGTPGVGKTQCVIEYFYRDERHYRFVHWINSDSKESVMSGYASIAIKLGLLQMSASEKDLVEAAKEWLTKNNGWLIVFDNLQEFETVRELIPTSNVGHVIITTPAVSTGLPSQTIETLPMEINDASMMLLRRAGLLDTKSGATSCSEEVVEEARKIAAELGGLPLAIEQAGAYIEDSRCSLSEYLFLYQKYSKEMLERRGTIWSAEHPLSVLTTFVLCLEKVDLQNRTAGDFLRFCSMCAPGPISIEILRAHSDLCKELESTVKNPFKLNEALLDALRYSMLRRDSTGDNVEMHRLVQLIIRTPFNPQQKQDWAQRLTAALGATFPIDTTLYVNWEMAEQQLPHALFCVEWIRDLNLNSIGSVQLLISVGAYLHVRAKNQEAVKIAETAIEVSKKLLPTENVKLEYSVALNLLSQIKRQLGEFDTAINLLEQSLELREEFEDGESLVVGFNNLAGLYSTLGRQSKAEPIVRKAIQLCIERLSSNHLHLATSYNMLGAIHLEQGRLDEADKCFSQSLHIYKKTYNDNHPMVARMYINIGAVLLQSERLVEAEEILLKALRILKEIHNDKSHPEVLTAVNNLSRVYLSLGKYQDAGALLVETLDSCNDSQNSGNKNEISKMLMNLGIIFASQKRFHDAIVQYKKCIALRKNLFGEHHHYISKPLTGLAEVYSNQRQYLEANRCFAEALDIVEKDIGFDNPDAAEVLHAWAMSLISEGNFEDGKTLLRRCLSIRKRHLSDNHPDLKMTRKNWGKLISFLVSTKKNKN